MFAAMPKLDAAGIEAFIAKNFARVEGWVRIEDVTDTRVRVRLPFRENSLRPGGTISGPTLMALADTAMYYLVLANIGPAVHTVTVNLNMNFLRRPEPGDLLAEAELLKLGKKLAVGDVRIHSDGKSDPVAQASVTYSVPSS